MCVGGWRRVGGKGGGGGVKSEGERRRTVAARGAVAPCDLEPTVESLGRRTFLTPSSSSFLHQAARLYPSSVTAPPSHNAPPSEPIAQRLAGGGSFFWFFFSFSLLSVR